MGVRKKNKHHFFALNHIHDGCGMTMAGNTTRMGTVLLLRYVAIHANNQTVIWFVNYQFCGLALDSNTIPYNLSRYLLTIFKEMQGISRYLKIAMKEFAGFSFSCFPTAYHVGTPKDGFHMGSTNFVDQQNSIITCKYLWIGK